MTSDRDLSALRAQVKTAKANPPQGIPGSEVEALLDRLEAAERATSTSTDAKTLHKIVNDAGNLDHADLTREQCGLIVDALMATIVTERDVAIRELADVRARGEALAKFVEWLSTYEKNPPEIVKDAFAYDRLLMFVHELCSARLAAWRAARADASGLGEKPKEGE